MGETSLLSIFFTALLIQNVALFYLLGMCPFVALSRSLKTAFGMGAAVIFVVTLTSSANWVMYQLLEKTGSQIIQYIVFIIVIAACVQLVEMIMERFFPALQSSFGIFLPLITVNCTVLFISLKVTVVDNLSYIQSVVYSVSAAIGFWLAMILVAAIYEKLDLIGNIPKGLQGPGIIMIITGIMALAFMGFSGMV
ncbi:MAG: Rnf-Nqr domain containing protein [Desulfocapsaceae bacterium]|jgi:Na+-transporting NADH:ubiquinone oxidoreductase subunit E|nr:Rnf-Nqr domain containing protein [Desulfocapsaceae bacterium]